MSSQKRTRATYDEALQGTLSCKICFQPFREARLLLCCEHTCCGACLARCNGNCPWCRKPVASKRNRLVDDISEIVHPETATQQDDVTTSSRPVTQLQALRVQDQSNRRNLNERTPPMRPQVLPPRAVPISDRGRSLNSLNEYCDCNLPMEFRKDLSGKFYFCCAIINTGRGPGCTRNVPLPEDF